MNGGKGVWRRGEREIIYLSLHWHHHNDFSIKMGSAESHFNVSVGSDGQSHKTVSTNHNLLERRESRSGIEPEALLPYQPNALPLGQTGPQCPQTTTFWNRRRAEAESNRGLLLTSLTARPNRLTILKPNGGLLLHARTWHTVRNCFAITKTTRLRSPDFHDQLKINRFVT